MPAIIVENHARLRMRQRRITADDIAHVWTHHHRAVPAETSGFTVRTGEMADGRTISVVAKLTSQVFHVKTVWEVVK
jgi:hypothetical protein